MRALGARVGGGSVSLAEISSTNAQAWPMDDLLPGPRGLPAVVPACVYSGTDVKGLRVELKAGLGGEPWSLRMHAAVAARFVRLLSAHRPCS